MRDQEWQDDLSDQDGHLLTHGRIAVIEDDETSRYFLVQALRAHGYRVKGIEDGASAMPHLRVLRPDIILLDVSLPVMTGFDVCRLIRRDPLLRHAVVILLTGRASAADRMAGWKAGIDDYLIKPCEVSEILARIAAYLRSHDTMQRQHLNPVTNLPAVAAVEEALVTRVQQGIAFGACYANIAHFQSYNDRYGYLEGDGLLVAFANVLRDVVHELNTQSAAAGQPELCFAGHLGSDEFLLITAPEQLALASELLANQFSAIIPSSYRSVDRDRGWVPGVNRPGELDRIPLIALNLATTVYQPAAVLPDEPGQTHQSITADLWHQLRAVVQAAEDTP